MTRSVGMRQTWGWLGELRLAELVPVTPLEERPAGRLRPPNPNGLAPMGTMALARPTTVVLVAQVRRRG